MKMFNARDLFCFDLKINTVDASYMHGLKTNEPAYALRQRLCNGMFSGAVYILILIVM